MEKYTIKPQYQGLTITVRTVNGTTLSLDTRGVSQDDLAAYKAIPEFSEYIETYYEYELTRSVCTCPEACEIHPAPEPVKAPTKSKKAKS
jgi:hypothetical protein